MKRDKNLEKIADKSIENMLSDDFHAKLMNEYDNKPVKSGDALKKVRLIAMFSSLCIVVILAVIIPCCIWLWNAQGDDDTVPEKYYSCDDELSVDAVLDDVNAALAGYRIKPDYVTSITFVKDSVSGDGLYYIVEMQDGFTTCRIDFVINPNYRYIEETTVETVSAGDLEIDCRKKTNYEEEYAIYTHTVYGETVIGNTRVYFKVYDTFTEGIDDGFEEFVQNIFIKTDE